jgi:NAD(P)-dependent dehydrogenase (short-subunit alcohol dehydrogenase family)
MLATPEPPGDRRRRSLTPADWAAFFAVNLYGVMHCVRAVTPSMVEALVSDHDHLRRRACR